jgi:CBS domain-containing protein
MYTMSDLMTRELVTLREGDGLEVADALIESGHIRHLPVVANRKLVGLLTHRDLLRHCRRRDPYSGSPILAGEVMRREVVTVRPETSARAAIRLMLDRKLGCLPVTTEDGTLVGIVTEADLLKVADARLEEIDRRELAAEYED